MPIFLSPFIPFLYDSPFYASPLHASIYASIFRVLLLPCIIFCIETLPIYNLYQLRNYSTEKNKT